MVKKTRKNEKKGYYSKAPELLKKRIQQAIRFGLEYPKTKGIEQWPA